MEDFTLKKLNEKQIKLKIQELKEEFKKRHLLIEEKIPANLELLNSEMEKIPI